MKRLRPIYLLAITSLFLFAACQDDQEELQKDNTTVQGDQVNVTLRIAPAGAYSAATRATDWQDENVNVNSGLDEEMMNIWTVVMVNDNGNKVERIFVGKPTYTPSEAEDDNREIDEVAADLQLTAGAKYHFYSFANIAPTKVFELLGLSVLGYTAPEDNAVVTLEASAISAGQATIVPKPAAGGNVRYVDDVTVSLGANGKVYTDLSKTDPFGFGSKGIPMSNVQTYTVPSGSATKDLIVVRMFAKLQFPIYNETASDITLKSITISDVTLNPTSSEETLKLLPTLTNHDTMESTHKDLQADVAMMPSATVGDYTYTVPADQQTIAANTKYENSTPATTLTFYINESKAPTNADGLYYLTVELDDHDYRYALISQEGKTPDDNDAWDYIARNDYRIIPIVLDDYKLEIIPYDFPEIGVYPASVHEVDATKHVYEMLFHDYGHFHLLPVVTHSAGTEQVDFVSEAPTTPYSYTASAGKAAARWGLIGDDWTKSFKSYTDATAASVYNPAVNKGLASDADPTLDAATYSKMSNFFYGQPGSTGLPADNDYPTSLPAYGTAVDYSENGDWPVFYNNDGATQWKPKAADEYRPYIFGQIAPQVSGADKKVFHEFKVNLYVSGSSTPRILTYRFYMHLTQDHATARRRSASRCH